MKRLLIANRGEISLRIQRTAHRLGIETVAVYSEADADAPHVRGATLAHALGGNTSAESYLRIDQLLAAAQATGAQAVHPGYGFLSENADFAQAVQEAGLLWVGPPPAAIRALGSKSGAKRLALARGVPCLPGYQGEDQSDDRLAAEAARIGFPLMVKATAGGGGRGMRLVREASQLGAALQGARSEALSAFGSGELLLERALLAPRHVEVQVFADGQGRCIHLGERDCSVQRRHQKIIEETPSPAVDAALRERMGRAAVELAQAAGYVGAGTVEFLLEGGSDFFLMEMNTRLQVEHCVTEMATGLDLVEWQLRVARGEPLPLTQEQVRFEGHAVEVRLCAEDEDFVPHAGRVLRFRSPLHSGQEHAPGLRFDHALEDGWVVPPYYDSMLGKLIAHGATRAQAIERLIAGLQRTELLGLPNNRAFLAACLAQPTFREGRALIPFLAEQGDAVRGKLLQEEQAAVVVCALAAYAARSAGAHALACSFPRPLRFRHRGQLLQLGLRELGAGRCEVSFNGRSHDARLAEGGSRSRWAITLDGTRHEVSVAQLSSTRWHLQCRGTDLWLDDATYEPAVQAGAAQGGRELRAPFNGKVIALPAQPGQAVRQGETLAVLESMKLEHALAAPRDARVKSVRVEVGQQVATSQVLLELEDL